MATFATMSNVLLPRITIKYCTQCKWMLRAAYFAQELLSTFSTSLGEVSLVPSTGGIFAIEIIYQASDANSSPSDPIVTRLWDRKTDGGFPEVKHLKQLVRDVIDPDRDLGHVDRSRREKVGNDEREAMEKGSPTEVGTEKGEKSTEGIGVLNASEKASEGTSRVTENGAGEGGSKNGAGMDRSKKDSCEDCD